MRTLSCAGCKHQKDPVCRCVLIQLQLAEERIRWFVAAHKYRMPEIDVTVECKSRDFYHRS